MKQTEAGLFKARCLKGHRDCTRNRGTRADHKTRKPIAQLVPASQHSDDFLGRLKGIVKITGDIESSPEPLDAWNAPK